MKSSPRLSDDSKDFSRSSDVEILPGHCASYGFLARSGILMLQNKARCDSPSLFLMDCALRERRRSGINRLLGLTGKRSGINKTNASTYDIKVIPASAQPLSCAHSLLSCIMGWGGRGGGEASYLIATNHWCYWHGPLPPNVNSRDPPRTTKCRTTGTGAESHFLQPRINSTLYVSRSSCFAPHLADRNVTYARLNAVLLGQHHCI
ncbi:hypothetical protein Salat_1378700 [Sesamum alatum]|uniref:Uncharacterized protein n=1 Tax=Sesamum alatum TaxID=300844 RepID=A0AAE1Y9X9_9LAMI|nr:hypothetical protein Salat_1378700 [Sesamum alatum]